MTGQLASIVSANTPKAWHRRPSLFIFLSVLVIVHVVFPVADGAAGGLETAPATLDRSNGNDRNSRALSAITLIAGSGQVAPIKAAFAIRFGVLVTDHEVPQSGVTVTFTAPSQGPSGTFDGSVFVEVVTDDHGVATAPPFTANDIAGTYQVIAATTDGSTLFDLTNGKGNQTIDFPPVAARSFGDAPFDVHATASSSLPVSFGIISGPAVIDGNRLTITGVGLVTVTATQMGDDNYNPAPSVAQSFTVVKAEQIITFVKLSNTTFGIPDFGVTATASSGLSVLVTATGHCTVIGLMVHLTGGGSCTLTASQDGDDNFNAAPNIRQSFFIAVDGEQLFDVRSFGAIGDGVANDSGAFQAALDAIGNAGGGTIIVPEGRYALTETVTFTGHAKSMSIRGLESDVVVDASVDPSQQAVGLNLLSEIFPRTGSANAISISGLEKFFLSDIAFVGTPDVETDAAITLYITDVDDATIKHSEFYGLRTMVPGAGIVLANRSGLTIQDTKFLGSFGNSGTYTPNVQNIEWKAITISNVLFIDYGMRPELYCKCQEATFSWINIGNAAAVTSNSPRREVSIRNVFLDEGAYNGLTSLPYLYQPASAPIDLVYVSGLRMNVSNFGASGNYLVETEGVLITNSYYGWSHNADAAIILDRAGKVLIQRAECEAAANRIKASAGTESLTVINSTYAELDSQAQVTREIVTANADDDPVQYVYSKFTTALGREPDPAAHFYWSNLLLQCGDNSVCVASEKAALDSYLSNAPAATVTFAGEIKDEYGTALPNVTVRLTGAQATTAETAVNGRYSFVGLPSSGIYTVTPTLAHYTFSPTNRTFTTPATNQTIDFHGKLDRLTISGTVTTPDGVAVSGAAVTLTGAQTRTTTTGVDGEYIFPDVPAGGDETVSVTKAHYVISPANHTFSDLGSNQTASFTAIPPVTFSGQATADNMPMSGVTVTVTGTESTSITTDSAGNYVMTVAVGSYVVTPTKSHYSFNPENSVFTNVTTSQIVNFPASLNCYTISGRVADAANSAVANVTVTLTGTQTTSVVTDNTGQFTFAGVGGGGNYTIVASRSGYSFVPASYVFTDLSADQNMQISGNPPPPELMIDPNKPGADVVAGVESVLFTDGPFQVPQTADWLQLGVRNTRVMLFARNVTLQTGETVAAVTIEIVDANGQTFDVPAEDVRAVGDLAITQIIFRLPNNLAAGTCHLRIIFHGQVSNAGTLSIVAP